MKKLSRQRLLQIANNEKGLCIECNEPIFRAKRCESHWKTNRAKYYATRKAKRPYKNPDGSLTEELAGKVFGDWTVIKRDPYKRSTHRRWICRCVCGAEKSVFQSNLTRGKSTGCGCRKRVKQAVSRLVESNYQDLLIEEVAKIRRIIWQMDKYDSTQDTLKHIRRVQELMTDLALRLVARAVRHDMSKLVSPEKEGFDAATPKLAELTYGSDEYKTALKELGVALTHHYANNSHHPEYYSIWTCPSCQQQYTIRSVPPVDYPDSNYRWCMACHDGKYPGFFETALIESPGIEGMSLLDIIEMFCDWKAATERHNDGDILKSIEHNEKRFKIAPQLSQIFRNTKEELKF